MLKTQKKLLAVQKNILTPKLRKTSCFLYFLNYIFKAFRLNQFSGSALTFIALSKFKMDICLPIC